MHSTVVDDAIARSQKLTISPVNSKIAPWNGIFQLKRAIACC
ncbi:MAG: hypothetical protein RM347_024550 [Nostoc sp. ChiQUE02]|nr:hypothetical protein [Nostoc sp. ChiQUE02]MDZ8231446.1 hypothetical protein [Nostoc sp. ChiQUE02]